MYLIEESESSVTGTPIASSDDEISEEFSDDDENDQEHVYLDQPSTQTENRSYAADLQDDLSSLHIIPQTTEETNKPVTTIKREPTTVTVKTIRKYVRESSIDFKSINELEDGKNFQLPFFLNLRNS